MHEVCIIDNWDEHFVTLVQSNGFFNQAFFTDIIVAVIIYIECLAKDFDGICIGMKGPIECGEPGTGKSILKQFIKDYDVKRMIVPTLNRTLHTYTNTIKVLCQAFNIDDDGHNNVCEKRLIEEAIRLNQCHKMLVPIIDDAHLMHMDCLRRLRLLFEDFPKNHNLILIGQPQLLHTITLTVNEDIKSRVTFSATFRKLNPDQMKEFILSQLDQCGLGHNTFTEAAIDLIIRSTDGVLRQTKNLCLSSLLEAVRDQTRTVDIPQVNRVLTQPHWRKEYDLDLS
jgi:type II secretory pathway predicted ATPase ExeA